MTMRAASGTRWGPHPLAGENRTIDGGNEMSDYKLFVCVQCGFEYDEAKGWPEDGIAPGTRWDDIPEDWSCPDCGAAKSDFEMVEVARS
jgi:rubredoxin